MTVLQPPAQTDPALDKRAVRGPSCLLGLPIFEPWRQHVNNERTWSGRSAGAGAASVCGAHFNFLLDMLIRFLMPLIQSLCVFHSLVDSAVWICEAAG